MFPRLVTHQDVNVLNLLREYRDLLVERHLLVLELQLGVIRALSFIEVLFEVGDGGDLAVDAARALRVRK